MNGYGTERGLGHRNNAEQGSYSGPSSRIRHDDPYQMSDLPEGDTSDAFMADDQMNDNTVADPRRAFDLHDDDHTRDTHGSNYTLSHARSNRIHNRTRDNRSRRIHPGPRQNSHQPFRGQTQDQQSYYYATQNSANPHNTGGSYGGYSFYGGQDFNGGDNVYGGNDFYGRQIDGAPDFDFNQDPDYVSGFQQENEQSSNEPAYGAPENHPHEPQDYSVADQSGPGYGAYFEALPPTPHRPARGNRSRARGLTVHHSGEFVPGRVLITDWSEPRGHSLGTTVYSGTENNIFRKDRRFIIVSTLRGHSECLSIVTYGGRGCSKPGTHKEDHGIVYSGDEVPDLEIGEPELGFMPVRVSLYNNTEQLQAASRINYSKIHTVEHNFAVEFVGQLETSDLPIVRGAVHNRRLEADTVQFHNQ